MNRYYRIVFFDNEKQLWKIDNYSALGSWQFFVMAKRNGFMIVHVKMMY